MSILASAFAVIGMFSESSMAADKAAQAACVRETVDLCELVRLAEKHASTKFRDLACESRILTDVVNADARHATVKVGDSGYCAVAHSFDGNAPLLECKTRPPTSTGHGTFPVDLRRCLGSLWTCDIKADNPQATCRPKNTGPIEAILAEWLGADAWGIHILATKTRE